MSSIVEKYSYLQDWKISMSQTIRMRYTKDQISDKKIDAYLDSIIESKLNNTKVVVVNNYTHKFVRTGVLDLIELIRRNNLICAGGGCLFVQHAQKRNLLIEFILYIMAQRKYAKKMRATFDDWTDEYADWDRAQLAYKLIINSLYGCMGYAGFILFNIFLAEAITNQGRHIISSAINAIENFFGNSIHYENESDLLHVINNIDHEYQKNGKLSDAMMDYFAKEIDLTQLPQMVLNRFISLSLFQWSNSFTKDIAHILNNMVTDELIFMYYKNNFTEFNKLGFMKEKYRQLILANGYLGFCEDWSYKDDNCRAIVNEIWSFYELFVLYDYPIFDRLRKAMYTDKTKSLYTDTDSVFISLDETVKYVLNDVFDGYEESGLSEKDLEFTAANVALTISNRVIARAMKSLYTSINITDEYGKLLSMKNEFFFSRFMLTNVKKRYISLAMLQEGKVLNKGRGKPEIKGFDFKKAGTKTYIKEYYTNLCLEEILYPKEIDPLRVFKKVVDLKAFMEKEIANGSMEFFKQANVKRPEYYKNPYSTQGVNAILLWNALVPDKALEFPNDVNIVPITNLTWPKKVPTYQDGSPVKGKILEDNYTPEKLNRIEMSKPPEAYPKIRKFMEDYPEAYDRLNRAIYCSTNLLIQHMNLTSIAIPKNIDYELPEYIKALIDPNSIIETAMSLILPILKCIGIRSFNTTSNTEHMSNMIDL